MSNTRNGRHRPKAKPRVHFIQKEHRFIPMAHLWSRSYGSIVGEPEDPWRLLRSFCAGFSVLPFLKRGSTWEKGVRTQREMENLSLQDFLCPESDLVPSTQLSVSPANLKPFHFPLLAHKHWWPHCMRWCWPEVVARANPPGEAVLLATAQQFRRHLSPRCGRSHPWQRVFVWENTSTTGNLAPKNQTTQLQCSKHL